MIKNDYLKYRYKFGYPEDCPVLRTDILEDPNVDDLLNQYINNLDSFVTMVEDYLNGKKINEKEFEELSNSLYTIYCNNDNVEMIFRALDMYYLNSIKMFFEDYKNGEFEGLEMDFVEYFNVIVCDEVMIKYYSKNPNIVKKYIELNKRLDAFVAIDIYLKDRNIKGLKDTYDTLVKNGEVDANPDIEKLLK